MVCCRKDGCKQFVELEEAIVYPPLSQPVLEDDDKDSLSYEALFGPDYLEEWMKKQHVLVS
jgi:hypothetical protein